MSDFIRQFKTSQVGLKANNNWVILSLIESAIKNKIEKVGTF